MDLTRGQKKPYSCVAFVANHHLTKERFSYDLEMKTREQNGSKQTNENTAIWLVYEYNK